jgi:TolB protein
MQETSPAYYIAYNVLVDSKTDNYDVFAINLDGSNKRNITNHKDLAWTYFAWKERLFFISDRDTARRNYYLYVTDDAGKSVRKVTDLRLEDSFMGARNDGRELVVTGRIGPSIRNQLFLVNVGSGTYTQLTNDTSAMYSDPTFSPDGKSIVYRYRKEKRNRMEKADLWIINLDSRTPRQLTHYPAGDTTAPWHAHHAGPPRWHPTENFVSYLSMQNGKYSLYGITADGKKQWKLLEAEVANQGWHDWSDDGKWLVFDGSNAHQSQYDIYLVNWQTKDVKKLTDTTYKFQQAPVFVRAR